VIAISGGTRNGTITFLPIAKKLGADFVFEKPVTLEKLLSAVQTALAGTPGKQT
jgi:hypothetical protein